MEMTQAEQEIEKEPTIEIKKGEFDFNLKIKRNTCK